MGSRLLVDTAEVGGILGVSRRRAASLARCAPGFPEPVRPISEGLFFDRSGVEAWAATHPDRGPARQRPSLPPPGEMARTVHRIRNLAASQSAELNHHWIGDVHLLLALLHPDCPGAARAALEAFGLAHEAVRRTFVGRLDRAFDTAPAGQSYHPGMLRILEQASLEALELQDDEVDSEHVLLALAGVGEDSAAHSFLAEAEADSPALCRQVIALTEGTSAVCEPPGPASARDRPMHAAELARLLGASRREAVQLAFSAPDFPLSEVVSEGYRVWPRHLVEAWAAAHPERDVRHRALRPRSAQGMVPRADEVLSLARASTEELNHRGVSPDHLLLALLHPACPGNARQVLESLGTDLDQARRSLAESMGDPFEPDDRNLAVPPATHEVLDAARLKALELEDEEVVGEHVLLALADRWWQSSGSILLIRRGIDAEAVHRRLLALSDGLMPAPPPSPPPHWRRVARRVPRPPEPELAPSPAGHDPHRRQPWGSRMLRDKAGRVAFEGRALRQYSIDRDGYPVLSTCGRLVSALQDEKGVPVLDEEGHVIRTTIEVPPGSTSGVSIPRRLT